MRPEFLLLSRNRPTPAARASVNALRSSQDAFSLVEVALSLGILAFVLVGITGLLSNSLTTQRESTGDTAYTQITHNVVEDLRGRTLDQVVAGVKDRYFYADGSPCDAAGSSAAVSKGAIYLCATTAQPDPATKSVDGTVNMLVLKLHVSWPLQSAATTGPYSKDIYVNLARY